MKKIIGEEIGALLGNIIEVNCDTEGGAMGRCMRVRVLLDVHNPIIRWTNISVGGVSRKILFRYEKLSDFCYACGRIDHLLKNCTFTHPDGLFYYGPWLREKGQNPTSLEEAAGDLNRLNARKVAPTNDHSPHTSITNDTANPTSDIPLIPKPKTNSRGILPIPMIGLNINSPTSKNNDNGKGSNTTPTPDTVKPNWEILIPKPNI